MFKPQEIGLVIRRETHANIALQAIVAYQNN